MEKGEAFLFGLVVGFFVCMMILVVFNELGLMV